MRLPCPTLPSFFLRHIESILQCLSDTSIAAVRMHAIVLAYSISTSHEFASRIITRELLPLRRQLGLDFEDVLQRSVL